MSQAKAYIGTSGWNYADWRVRFYPKGLPTSKWLAFLSRHFPTVEINNSFYRIPRAEMVTRWNDQVPAGFRFAIKLWRGITHFRKLTDCQEPLQQFFAAFAGMTSRHRGPLLVQLPPSQGCDVAKIDRFLHELWEVTAPQRWKVAVEFRHPSWLCDEAYRCLDRHRAAVCLHDMPRCPVVEPNDGPFVYVRRHGPTGRYAGCYSPAQIGADAERIRAWLAEGRTVFVYFNNDVEGYAVRNADELRHAVGV